MSRGKVLWEVWRFPGRTGATRAHAYASIGITLDTYSHVLPSLREDAARDLDAGSDPGPSR
jgi:hypothetical protein